MGKGGPFFLLVNLEHFRKRKDIVVYFRYLWFVRTKDRKETTTMPYTHLSAYERGQVQALSAENKSNAYIAKRIGRSRATIGRELRRNTTRNGYQAQRAHQQYRMRRQECRPARRLEHPPLWTYLFDKLSIGWTPEEIAGRLPLAYPDDLRMRISHETIYQSLYADKRLHCLLEHLPQARPKRRKRGQGKTRRGPSIPNRVGIEERPNIIEERTRFGDWEADTIVGAGQQGFIATLVDRTSRLLHARKCDTKHAGPMADTVIHALQDMPISWVKTITFDNGTEFADHQTIADTLNVDTYFADPYCSWQRGTNENTNGLIRRYLPKGTCFKGLTQDHLDFIINQLNNRPRKILRYRTPNEVFQLQRQKHPVALSA